MPLVENVLVRMLTLVEITSPSDSLRTSAGSFTNVLRVRETTPLEPGSRDTKRFAPGIGLVEDGTMRLVRYGTTP